MAGAVSAGAYTAGAVDYLIEALEEWQKRKDNGDPNTPSHQVEISVIGGASAGGMTGIVLASAIQDNIVPVRKLGDNIMAQNPDNKLYHSWVDLLSDEMLHVLLDTSDISKNGLQSVLNSEFIDEIATRAMKVSDEPAIRREYFSDGLKLFVTLSNLEGMEFTTTFRSNSPNWNRYFIKSHNDYACFKLCNSESEYDNDGWIPLNFKLGVNSLTAKEAAMGTGAFPVGLKAREVSRSVKYMNDLNWFKHITQDARNPFIHDPYETVNVDGGMINNEPFDRTMDLLMDDVVTPEKLEKMHDYNKFNSTVLMIDPFPSGKDDDISNSSPNNSKDDDTSTKLTTIIARTLGAMINQSRIKTSVLVDAMDSDKAGQYLIAPTRYENIDGIETFIEGGKAIACGSLGGFGGFINKEFRIHDYFLGRANCEKFLRDHFTVPAGTTNEIFVNGYSELANKKAFTSKTDGGLQIIPIFTDMQPKPYMPQFSNSKEWPSVTTANIGSYRKKIKARVEKVLFNIANYSKIQRILLWIGAKMFLNGRIADAVINTVVESLEEHQQIK